MPASADKQGYANAFHAQKDGQKQDAEKPKAPRLPPNWQVFDGDKGTDDE